MRKTFTMRYQLFIPLLLLLLMTVGARAQQTDRRHISIVDTLTQQEKANRNPVLLRSELDSLIQLYNLAQPVQQSPPAVKEIIQETTPVWVWIMQGVTLLVIGLLLYNLFAQQRASARKIQESNSLLRQSELLLNGIDYPSPGKAGKSTDRKISALQNDIEKLRTENEDLSKQLTQYQVIKEQIASSYKIRNYPGYDKSQTEDQLLRSLIQTERNMANYAYEHFLKPVIAIADSHKNNPARIPIEDRTKLVELLLSLSLFYSEYLYLRVNELSVGGNMIARIQGLNTGKQPDTLLMKQLSTEHGSRALVLRLILDKMDIIHLSYPVFDETNLNLS